MVRAAAGTELRARPFGRALDDRVRRSGALPHRSAPRRGARHRGAAAAHRAVPRQRARRRGARGRQPRRGCSWCSRRCRCRTCSSSTAIWPRRPPRGIAATLVVNKERPRDRRRARAPSSPCTRRPATPRVRCSADERRGPCGSCARRIAPGRGRGARRTVRRRQVLAGRAASCRRRRWRSASWCARRKAATRPPRRGSSTCPGGAASSTHRACATLRRRSHALDERSARVRRGGAARAAAAASPTAATCASRGCAVRAAAESRHVPSRAATRATGGCGGCSRS